MKTNNNLNIKGTNVLIIGNRSYKNLGDELILAGTIKLLQQKGKKVFIQAYDPKWLKGFLKQFVDVSEITFLTEIPKGFRSLLRYLRKKGRNELLEYRKIHSVIVGGGEILTEENPNSYRYRLVSLLPLLIKKIVVKVDIYLMGGIQIPKKNLNIKLFNYLLQKTSHIYARDFETVDALKTYGYKDVEFFMDTAYFAWDWKMKGEQSGLSRHIRSSQGRAKYIIVNVNKNGERFLENIINDIQQYVKKGFHIYYVPVSKGKNAEYNDGKYYDLLKYNTHLALLDWEHDFATFLDVVKGAEIVISTRLHLFLIASFLGTKTKVYPYQNKIVKMQKVLTKVL